MKQTKCGRDANIFISVVFFCALPYYKSTNIELLLFVNKDSAYQFIFVILLFLFTIIFKNNYIHTYMHVYRALYITINLFPGHSNLNLNYSAVNNE